MSVRFNAWLTKKKEEYSMFIIESKEVEKAKKMLERVDDDLSPSDTLATVGLAHATLAQADASLIQAEVLDRIACALDRIAEVLEKKSEEKE